MPETDPVDIIAEKPNKKGVVGPGNKKRKSTTPTKYVRPKLADVLLVSESEELSFHPTEGDEAMQDDSSDDDDDDDDNESIDRVVPCPGRCSGSSERQR